MCLNGMSSCVESFIDQELSVENVIEKGIFPLRMALITLPEYTVRMARLPFGYT